MQVAQIRQNNHHGAVKQRMECIIDKLKCYTNYSEISNIKDFPIHDTMSNPPKK